MSLSTKVVDVAVTMAELSFARSTPNELRVASLHALASIGGAEEKDKSQAVSRVEAIGKAVKLHYSDGVAERLWALLRRGGEDMQSCEGRSAHLSTVDFNMSSKCDRTTVS
jgi:hypothetical protein